MPEDLNAMSVFVAVSDAKGFRAAGERLGVSASAVSQALRKLETQIGVVLVHRTTRSVRLRGQAPDARVALRERMVGERRGALAAQQHVSGLRRVEL
ncbi:MAG: LysR family transcriptional regulator, partial [Gemmatimonadetes bacterium]|nr:LysR family transcriptional regulator [Gemmatimonadota bacterium]